MTREEAEADIRRLGLPSELNVRRHTANKYEIVLLDARGDEHTRLAFDDEEAACREQT